MSAHLYADPAYARALSALGRVVDLPEWGGFVLARAIPREGMEDATGAYPRAVLDRDADLAGGLARLAGAGLVSVVLATSRSAGVGPPATALATAFGVCRPFKTHYLVDRAKGYAPTKHHRDRIRRGLRRCRVERVSLAERLDDWRSLYAGLVASHDVRGAADFAPVYFDALAGMAQVVALGAFVGETLAAMTLWFEYDGVAYSHLTASSALGYANGAAFALNDAAIGHFADCAVIDLGGAAGMADSADDGLAQFKRGFANAEATALICGAVLDEDAYARPERWTRRGRFLPGVPRLGRRPRLVLAAGSHLAKHRLEMGDEVKPAASHDGPTPLKPGRTPGAQGVQRAEGSAVRRIAAAT